MDGYIVGVFLDIMDMDDISLIFVDVFVFFMMND